MQFDPAFAPEAEWAAPVADTAGYFVTADQRLVVFCRGSVAYVNDVRVLHGIARLFADGALDAGFMAQLNEEEAVVAAAGLPDGRMFVATSSGAYMSPESGRFLRLLANGQIDPSFAAKTGLTGGVKVVRLTDGSVAAWGDSVGVASRSRLIRFSETGAVDPSFASSLIAEGARVTSLVATSGARVVLTATTAADNGSESHSFIRLTAAGEVDSTFVGASGGALRVLAALPDDRLLVWDGGLRRLNADGSPDSTFVSQLPAVRAINEVIVLSEERLAVEVVTGSSEENAVPSVFVLEANGAVERDGRALPGGERIQSLAAAFADGRVVLAQGPLVWKADPGRDAEPGMAEPALTVLDPAAGSLTSLDTTIERVSAGAARIDRLASDANGRILIEGDFTHIAGSPRSGYARFNADGTLDPAFQPVAVTPLFHLPDGAMIAARRKLEPADAEGFHAFATEVVRLGANGNLDSGFSPAPEFDLLRAKWYGEAPDGRILALALQGGVATEENARLIWLNRDGSLAATLATAFGGFLNSPGATENIASALNNIAPAAAILPEGKILLGIYFVGAVNGAAPAILVRLNADGSTDQSYRPVTDAVTGVLTATPLPDGGADVYWLSSPGVFASTALRLKADGSPDTFVAREFAASERLADGSYLHPYEWRRFHGDGTPDLNFNPDIPADHSFGSRAMAGDGSIWVAARYQAYRENGHAVLRRLQPMEVEGFTVQPASRQAIAGLEVRLQGEIGTADAATFQWTHDGEPIAGATSRVLRVAHPRASDAGEYRLVATVGDTTYTSEGAALTVQPNPARLVNFSARAAVAPGYPPQIGGFVLRNASPRTVLLRGVGRGLPVDDPGFALLPDPVLTLYRGSEVMARDAGGARARAVTDLGAQLGAVALRPTWTDGEPTRDSALLQVLSGGIYTAHVGSADGRSGVSLFEFYDGEPAHATSAVANVSVRGRAAPGHDALIAGFVVQGPARLRLLIRGIGPGLEEYGVTGVVADPQITLFDVEGRVITANNDWAQNPDLAELSDAADRAGAFSLPEASRDAALMVELDPGIYTVHGRGAEGAAGAMMIELYVLEE